MDKTRHLDDNFGQGESRAMRIGASSRTPRSLTVRLAASRHGGFSLIELLIGMSILAVGLLAIAGMFSTGYMDVAGGGKTTMATTAARQLLEDIRTLPFDRLTDLNGFNTSNTGTVPAVDVALNPGRAMAINMARKWRYVLAGNGAGWNLTSPETDPWDTLRVANVPFGARGTVAVASPTATLRQITVTVFIPGHAAGEEIPLTLSTLISRL
jgi:prepilin-type N-terminal cleavage/methylation domain-containing protein